MADQTDEEVAAMFDLTAKKKKKKSKKEATDANEPGADASEAPSSSSAAKEDSAIETPPSYTYSQLLTRVVDLLHQNNPEAVHHIKYKIPPPSLVKMGTKKTLWENFQEVCDAMHRHPDHVFQFVMAELGTEGSIDSNKRLVIKGKFLSKYVESLLRKYIGEYVTCQMCRSFNTELTKDSVSRLYFVHCLVCGSSRSVVPIKAGFHAQTRADRRAARNV